MSDIIDFSTDLRLLTSLVDTGSKLKRKGNTVVSVEGSFIASLYWTFDFRSYFALSLSFTDKEMSWLQRQAESDQQLKFRQKLETDIKDEMQSRMLEEKNRYALMGF